MDSQETESLHLKASSDYLQGNLEAALETWRRLLAADPDDERAAEGVRLCEQMIGSQPESVCTEGRSPFAVGASGGTPSKSGSAKTAAGQGLADTLDDLLDLGSSQGAAAPAAPSAGSDTLDLSDLSEEFAEDPDGQERPAPALWDFGDLSSSPGGAPSEPERGSRDEPPSPPAPTAASQWDFGEVGEDELSAERAASEQSRPGPAEIEVRRRINELLASVLMAMERGERQEALRTVGRILILDEENEAALSLKAKLEDGTELAASEVDAGDEPNPVVLVDETLNPEVEALELDPEVMAQRESPLPALEADSSGGEAIGSQGSLLEEDLIPVEQLVAEPSDGESDPSASAERQPRPNPTLLLALGAAVVLAGGWWIWSTFLAAPEPEAEAVAISRPATDPIRAEQPPEPAPVADPSPAVMRPEEDRLAAALERAGAAEAAGDPAAVVLALGEALELDPQNASLRERLRLAAERYRHKQEREEKWSEAVAAFENGSYREALAFFYRVPEAEATPQIQRYLLNGWYNLGLSSLQSQDCGTARSHLLEARQIDPGDPGVQAGLDLAHRCVIARDRDWRRSVSQLRLRSLDD